MWKELCHDPLTQRLCVWVCVIFSEELQGCPSPRFWAPSSLIPVTWHVIALYYILGSSVMVFTTSCRKARGRCVRQTVASGSVHVCVFVYVRQTDRQRDLMSAPLGSHCKGEQCARPSPQRPAISGPPCPGEVQTRAVVQVLWRHPSGDPPP